MLFVILTLQIISKALTSQYKYIAFLVFGNLNSSFHVTKNHVSLHFLCRSMVTFCILTIMNSDCQEILLTCIPTQLSTHLLLYPCLRVYTHASKLLILKKHPVYKKLIKACYTVYTSAQATFKLKVVSFLSLKNRMQRLFTDHVKDQPS